MQTSEVDAPCTPESDRRRAVRQKLITAGVLLRDDPFTAPQPIMLKDVSLMGVGFESDAPVEPGETCTIRVQAGPMQITWRVHVVFCGKITGGAYRMGGQLLPVEANAAPAEQGFDADPLQELLILDA